MLSFELRSFSKTNGTRRHRLYGDRAVEQERRIGDLKFQTKNRRGKQTLRLPSTSSGRVAQGREKRTQNSEHRRKERLPKGVPYYGLLGSEISGVPELLAGLDKFRVFMCDSASLRRCCFVGI